MAAEPSENRVPDGPRISEDTWFGWAVGSFILTMVVFVVAAIWVFCGDPATIQQRAQVIPPFGAAMIAMVTFFTIAWRGVQTEKQLQYQAEQIRLQANQVTQVIRQNDAKEDENLTKVLQEGAKLIADKDKTSQALAGISSLDYLVRRGVSPFAEQAADLLSNFLMETYGTADLNRVSRAIITTLQRCEDDNITPTIEGVFEGPQTGANRLRRWSYIPAIQNITLIGGTLDAETFDRMRKRIKLLRNVNIHNAEIGIPDKIFAACNFRGCRIVSINISELLANKFYRCDFSNAVIDIDENTNNEFGFISDSALRENNNYYKSGRPPMNLDGNSMARWLLSEQELRIREGKELDI